MAWRRKGPDHYLNQWWPSLATHTTVHPCSKVIGTFFCNVEKWYSNSKYQCAILTYSSDVIMGAMASQIAGLTIVYKTVYSGADKRKHQSSALLAFVRGIHRWPVNSPHKWPVTRKMFPFDDVIMNCMHTILFHVGKIPHSWHKYLRVIEATGNMLWEMDI